MLLVVEEGGGDRGLELLPPLHLPIVLEITNYAPRWPPPTMHFVRLVVLQMAQGVVYAADGGCSKKRRRRSGYGSIMIDNEPQTGGTNDFTFDLQPHKEWRHMGMATMAVVLLLVGHDDDDYWYFG